MQRWIFHVTGIPWPKAKCTGPFALPDADGKNTSCRVCGKCGNLDVDDEEVGHFMEDGGSGLGFKLETMADGPS